MAPEQAHERPVGPYTDLYAVGVIAYELLAGRPPFERPTPVAVLYCHVHEPPPPLADVAPDVPPRVREWVEWLLSKAPADRPRSATRPGRRSRRSPSRGSDRTGAAPRRSHRSAPPPLEPERTAGTQLAQPLDRRLADERAPATQAAQPAQAGACGRRAPRRGRCRLRDPRRGSDDEGPPRGRRRQRIATPYDFDGDGKQELVLGMPVGGGAEDREAERACVGPERAHPEAAAPTDHAVGRWPAWPVRQLDAVRQRSRERRF